MDEKLNITLVDAVPADVDDILGLIRELAAYEKASDEVTITAADLLHDGFAAEPAFRVLLAKVNGETVGMAFWYFTYSTWKGRELYLEDLVVKPSWRNKGLGGMLFGELLRRASQYHVKRMRWQVLHWNDPALAFYKKYQVSVSNEWLNCTLSEDDIARLTEHKTT
jgi:GNAT superfamily N-acetyltransferase